MMRRRAALVAVGTMIVTTASGSVAIATDGDQSGGPNAVQVRLSGFQEDPQALSTAGSAQLMAMIDEGRQEISFRLSYRDLEGSITQAHIHLGGRAQSGGIAVFLCSNLPGAPAGTQPCPAAPGEVTGTLQPANVIGPGAQGIAPGEFTELVAAIHAGATYANVHTVKYPAGEVRGQLGHH